MSMRTRWTKCFMICVLSMLMTILALSTGSGVAWLWIKYMKAWKNHPTYQLYLVGFQGVKEREPAPLMLSLKLSLELLQQLRNTTPIRRSSATVVGISPMSKAKLSDQYITQLQCLQGLLENNVLTPEEFAEQKAYALTNLRSLNCQDS